MLETLREMEEMAQENMVPPERVENLEKLVAPLKQNYERWSYMIYLLNKPVNKKKYKWYKDTEGKKLKNISKENSLDGVFEENKKTIKAVANSFKDC